MSREAFVAMLAGGELSPTVPGVQARLAGDPELAREVAELRALAAGVEEGGALRAEALQTAREHACDGEEDVLDGFRGQLTSTPLSEHGAEMPRPRRSLSRALALAAAALIALSRER